MSVGGFVNLLSSFCYRILLLHMWLLNLTVWRLFDFCKLKFSDYFLPKRTIDSFLLILYLHSVYLIPCAGLRKGELLICLWSLLLNHFFLWSCCVSEMILLYWFLEESRGVVEADLVCLLCLSFSFLLLRSIYCYVF